MKMKVRNLMVGFLISLPVLFVSCNDEPDISNDNQQLQNEIAAIDTHLENQNIDAVAHISGVRIQILKLGKAFPAQGNSTVNVTYTGKLFTNGITFDDGIAQGALSTYIEGWQYALTSLPAGSEAVLYIPSVYGYGDAQQGAIPPNSILVFQITFNKVIYTSTELQRLGSDTTAVDSYLSTKGINAMKDTLGLRYVITQPGTGSPPTWYDQVTFKAQYRLLNNDATQVADVEFKPTEFNYNRVIDQIPDGVKLGLQKLGIGGKATFYIPSLLGYGTLGARNGNVEVIPPNSNIILDIELQEIVKQ